MTAAAPGERPDEPGQNPVSVRVARLADARRIAEIHVASWRSAYRGIVPDLVLDGLSVDEREKLWSSGLARGKDDLLVAEEAGRIVGWAAFGPSRDGDPPALAELYAIYLEPGRCRRGVGRRLWSAMARQLAAQGREAVTAWVLEANTPAGRFYEAMGGKKEAGRAKTLILGGKSLLEIRYRCPIAP